MVNFPVVVATVNRVLIDRGFAPRSKAHGKKVARITGFALRPAQGRERSRTAVCGFCLCRSRSCGPKKRGSALPDFVWPKRKAAELQNNSALPASKSLQKDQSWVASTSQTARCARHPRKRGSRLREGEQGFTLIEVLIAVVVLLAGIVAVAEMAPWAMRSDLISRETSIASNVAQRELQQMIQQSLTIQGGGSCSALSGQYYFCDADGNTIGLGQTGTTSTPTSAGCPLDSTGQFIDFTQPTSSCTSGYTVTEQIPWNPVSGTTQSAELRWRVVTMMNNGTPVRKFIVMGVRTSQVGGPALVNNYQVVVGPH